MTATGKHVPATAGSVELEAIVKRFGETVAVNGISLSIAAGEFVSLLGPSGCGKTTLLRAVAGFGHPDEGRIRIGGDDVTFTAPQERPTGMVFQSYALFPSMTVGENVAYGLQVRKLDKLHVQTRVREALARVNLSGYEQRPVTQLSGGQQQRVALARALAVRPLVLLFDEPLSNLDVALREKTRSELKELQSELGTTSLYVTHDQQEALALSDRIAVMNAGRLVQVGQPETLYREPATAFVARFLGGSNIVDHPQLMTAFAESPRPGADQVLAVRPENLHFASTGIEARVISRQFLGTYVEYWLEADGQRFRMWADPSVSAPAPNVTVAARNARWVADDTGV
ncbi:MAG: ABC transporter ATP-binding protein [Rhodothermales bacterium]